MFRVSSIVMSQALNEDPPSLLYYRRDSRIEGQSVVQDWMPLKHYLGLREAAVKLG